MKDLLQKFASSHFDSFFNDGRPFQKNLHGIPATANPFYICALFHSLVSKKPNCSLVVTAASNQEAERLATESQFFYGENRILYLPGYENLPYDFSAVNADISLLRLRGLYRILTGESLLVFTSPEALLRRVPAGDRIRNVSIQLKVDRELPQEELLQELVKLGYHATDRVELAGEFCRKGEVVDIFPVNETHPIRIDYFDNRIELIKLFDPENQITKEKRNESLILAAGEVLFFGRDAANFLKHLQSSKFDANLARPEWVKQKLDELNFHKNENLLTLTQLREHGIYELFPLALPSVTLLELFPKPPALLYAGGVHIQNRIAQMEREFKTLYEQEKQNRIAVSPDELMVCNFQPSKQTICFTLEESPRYVSSPSDEKASQELQTYKSPILPPESFSGRSKDIRERVAAILSEGGDVVITSPFSPQLRRVAGLFRNENEFEVNIIDDEDQERAPVLTQPDKKKKNPLLQIVRSPQHGGFVIPEFNFHLWSDSDIFGRSYKRRSRFKRTASNPIHSFLDLKEGDCVVHINHGIGRFTGLERIKAAGRERDFLVLTYADDDRLYVPLDQISLVQKYSSSTESPRLDSLGKASFKKVKERVEKRIEEFAQELIKIYAVRMSQKGYRFPPDTIWQEEFEADFQYDETPDQIAAIESVKQDMEQDRPMDRLICGDVGYGKTEVAIRASFKSVMAGRQVAVICPTTILAMQHHRNFTERFKNYPVRVDWISRFRSQAEIKAIKEDVKNGSIDVLIGTHAILSKELQLKNLGLLVVDEEQRFGVTHKEHIKQLKHLVDVITLSATPIPRTLHMSLVGIRDLSIIRTPPRDRLSVITYVLDDNDAVLVEAVQRELARGGQVFFLHNRVETIELAGQRIESLLPNVRYAVLHGQMPDDEIEDTLLDFLNHKYDLLITTSIIESGIDMPNVNTLIVDRADTFGLSQLYQMRGRVGRSSRQAYAYLFYPVGRSLTEQAQKRLNTILEYQELGSGFKVAMKDLEIRGAGNIIGKEQSGDIVEVGFELYVKLLEDAVRKLKGETLDVEVRCAIGLNTDFYLPENYIPDVRQRIEFYKRFEAARTDEEVDLLFIEMEDRFGKAPEQGVTFVMIEKIRTLASLCGFESVSQEESGRIRLKAGEHFRVPAKHLIRVMQSGVGLSVEPKNRETLFYAPAKTKDQNRLEQLVSILKTLAEPIVKNMQQTADKSA